MLKATADDVRYAYRLLLGREPDRAGYEHHVAYVGQNQITPTDLADGLMRSQEFAARGSRIGSLQEVDLHGVKIFPWRGDRLIGDHVAATGTYESHVLPLFLDSLKTGDVVLDIGANIGTYSLPAARRVGESGRVISVEPVTRNVQSLCAGVTQNKFSNVSILPFAASDRASVIAVLRHSDSSNGIVDTHIHGAEASDYVSTQRLDTVLAYLERLDVVKLDIEGHEPVAWPGLRALIERHRPLIFSEFSPVAIRNHSRTVPEDYLEALFEFAKGPIVVLHLDGERVECDSVSAIMAEWRAANTRMRLEGTLHVDLMVDTRK